MAVNLDGYSTTILFSYTDLSVAPPALAGFSLAFREKTVTPFAMKGGGALDATDMHNVKMRTQAPKSLLSSDPMRCSVYYDPAILTSLTTQMLINFFIALRHPDASLWQFCGWIDDFEPTENKEGDNPLATLTLMPSHIRPTLGASDKARGSVEYVPQYFPGPFNLPARAV